jgi:hypothetical protein
MGTTHYSPMQAPGASDHRCHRCTRPPLAPAPSLVEGLLPALASQAPATVPYRPRDHVQQEPARVAWEPVVHGAVALAEDLGQLAQRGRSRRGISAGRQAWPGGMTGLGWQGSPMHGALHLRGALQTPDQPTHSDHLTLTGQASPHPSGCLVPPGHRSTETARCNPTSLRRPLRASPTAPGRPRRGSQEPITGAPVALP